MSSRLFRVTAVTLFAAACVAGAARSTVLPPLTYPSTGACAKAVTGLDTCIGSAADGQTIIVKPGIYYEFGTLVDHPVTIKGTCGSTIIDASHSGTVVYAYDAFSVTAPGVTISCLTIRHANHGIDASNAAADNLTVKSNTFTGLNYSIALEGGVDSFDIEKNTFTGYDNVAVALDPDLTNVPNNDGKVIGNTFRNGYYEAVESFSGGDNMTITGNKFINLDDSAVAYGSFPLTNSLISGNMFTNAPTAIWLSTGSDGNTISKNTFGGVIASKAIEVDGDNAIVTGNMFTGTVQGSPVYVSGNGATVTSNVVKGGASNSGIYVDGGGPITVTGNTLGGGYAAPGVEVDCTAACAGSIVSKNSVVASFGGGDGMLVTDAGTCSSGTACFTVSNNSVTDAGAYGLELRIGFSTISGNKATNGGTFKETSAFRILGNHNTISSNTATGNAWDGFSLLGANDIVSSNTATGNGLDGFDIGEPHGTANASAMTFDKNIAMNNHGDGIRVYDSSSTNSIVVTNSKASGSHGYDCVIHNSFSLNVGASTGNACKDGSNFTQLERFLD